MSILFIAKMTTKWPKNNKKKSLGVNYGWRNGAKFASNINDVDQLAVHHFLCVNDKIRPNSTANTITNT